MFLSNEIILHFLPFRKKLQQLFKTRLWNIKNSTSNCLGNVIWNSQNIFTDLPGMHAYTITHSHTNKLSFVRSHIAKEITKSDYILHRLGLLLQEQNSLMQTTFRTLPLSTPASMGPTESSIGTLSMKLQLWLATGSSPSRVPRPDVRRVCNTKSFWNSFS